LENLFPFDEWNEKNPTHQKANGVVGKRSDELHSSSLGNKGKSPDESGNQQENVCVQVIGFHLIM